MRREPATALARAASAAVADGAGAIVAGMFGVVSALERACLDAGRFARGHARGRVETVCADGSYLFARHHAPVIRFPPGKSEGTRAFDVAC
jgi:hypothetical protein